jgi:hypothetical protein
MPRKYYTRVRFVLLFFLLVALLFLRKPDLLTNPQPFAEDGRVFLRDQLVFPWTAVFMPYNGQFHLVPRTIALVDSLFPMAAYATLCSVTSVLIHALCLSIFFLPWNRWLIENDLLRAAVCLVMATALDGFEMIGFSGPLMWYLFLAGILLLFRPESAAPQTARGRSTSVAAMAVIGMSAAPMVLLTPMAIWLAIKRRGIQRVLAVTLLSAMAVQMFALAFGKREDRPPEPLAGVFLLASQVAAATVVATVYAGAITPLAGKSTATMVSTLPTIGPPLLALIGLAAVVTWLLSVSPPHRRTRLAIGLYVAVGTLASALYTRNLLWLCLTLNSNAAATPARYLVLPGALLVYMACLILQRLPVRDPRLQAACLVLVFSLGIRHNFHQQPYPDLGWNESIPKIAAWRAARAQGKSAPLKVPIAPKSDLWLIDLP